MGRETLFSLAREGRVATTLTVGALGMRLLAAAVSLLVLHSGVALAQTQRTQPPAKPAAQPPKPQPQQAQQPQPQTPVAPTQAPAPVKFEIQRYVVEGNTLLSLGEIDRTVKPFTGKGRDFGDIQRALEALQNA